MFQIDSSNTIATMPVANPVGTPGWFNHGNPATGAQYTVLTSDWANTIQGEILNVVEAADLTPSKTNNSQLLQALQILTRIKITSPLTMYVNGTTGTDSNTSLSWGLTAGTPFATMQHAVNVITYNYDLVGQQAIINVADGVYAAGANVSGLNFSGGSMHFIGDVAAPQNCKVSLPANGYCFYAGENCEIVVSGFAVEAPHGVTTSPYAPGSIGLGANNGGFLFFDHVAFGVVTAAQISAASGGYVGLPSINTPYSIYGSAPCHMSVGSSSGIIQVSDAVVTISNSPSYSVAFASADSASLINAAGAAYFGTGAEGVRYTASNGGYIATYGGGANFFPGNAAGTVNTGANAGYYS